MATLVPHLYPVPFPGMPPYALGARPPRTGLGRRLWRAFEHPLERGFRRGRDELNETRLRLGLPALERLHGGISERLAIVTTFPQLEYPRAWPSWVHVVGPVLWEPSVPRRRAAAGRRSARADRAFDRPRSGRTAARRGAHGLRDEPVRVLAATNRRPPRRPVPVPPNAKLVDWISYSKSMPKASLVITHAGHGTLARALMSGAPVLAVPHSGDMAENAARADWAGVGVRLPWRLLSPATLRLAVRRALGADRLAANAARLRDWAAVHDGAAGAAKLVEELALSPDGVSARTR